MKVLFLVGLTGVGKSTVLPVLLAGRTGALLPDRRELTDRLIIPEAQRLAGQEPAPVSDRLERFRLTARYREAHSEGIVHALVRHLNSLAPVERRALESTAATARLSTQRPGAGQSNESGRGEPVFDGLRGVEEVTAATKRFPSARFLMLEARPETRIARLAGRSDAFDRVAPGRGGERVPATESQRPVAGRADASAGTSADTAGTVGAVGAGHTGSAARGPAAADQRLAELAAIPGVTGILDMERLVRRWGDGSERWTDLLRAVEIVVEEQRHYDQDSARRYLESLPPARRLILDTDELSSPAVARQVAEWL